MAEIFAAELRSDPKGLGQFVNLLFHVARPESMTILRALCGQTVEVAAGRKLDGFERELRRSAADDHGEVVGRAGGGAQRQDLFLKKGHEPLGAQQRGRRLEQKCLVGRTSALGDEQKLVSVLAFRIDLNL